MYFQHGAMRFDDLAYQRKAQTRAAVAPRCRAIQLMERSEDVLDPFGWHADPCIAHRNDDQILSFPFDVHGYAPLRGCEFASVSDQLMQHPGDFLRIRMDER